MSKERKNKTWYLVIVLLITPLFLLGGFYIYTLTNSEKEQIEQAQDATIQEDIALVPEIQTEIDQGQEWNTFFNMDYGYSVNHPNEWELDSSDLERVWFNIDENASILFASHTATQTGFPEYELIESIDINIDGVESTIVILRYVEDETVRTLLTFFECEAYPHFVMFSYNFQNQEQENEIFELNEKFLESIRFL